MACLYCGKELGPLQLLRSEEYCCVEHKKQYEDRLGRVLHRMADNEPRAIYAADFVDNWPLQLGLFKQIANVELEHHAPLLQWPGMFSLEILPLLTDCTADLGEPAAAAAEPAPAAADCVPAVTTESVLPPFEVAPAHESLEARVVQFTPRLCGICVPVPAPEPAVCHVEHRSVPRWQSPPRAVAYPAVTMVQQTPALARVEQFAVGPAAEPAEVVMREAAAVEPIAAAIAVQLPLRLERTLEPVAAPVAELAQEWGVRGREGAPALSPAVSGAAGNPSAPAPASTPESMPAPAGRSLNPVWLPERTAGIAHPSVTTAEPCDMPAMPVESMPDVRFAAEPVISTFALHYPEFNLTAQGVTASVAEAGEAETPATAESGDSHTIALPLAWMPGIEIASPQANFTASMETAIPQGGPVPLEFFCKRANSVPVAPLTWMMPPSHLRRPKMTLAPVLPPLEQPAPPPAPRKKKEPASVIQLPTRRSASLLREIAKPLAACFLVGGFVWLGATAMRVGTHTAAVNRDVATLIPSETESTVGAQNSSSSSGSTGSAHTGKAPAAAQQPGVIARMRQAVASRAASQLTETFHEGMGAWSSGGTGPGSTPPTWARSAEGFIRPASFGLFRPSADYKDYRVEFFGQIEQKSMSWAVRASDPNNYYGMRVTVTEPGPRPVVAIEHYPVVDGKKGRRSQVPLPELMFHNNTPYHIEVAVRGNRVTTSIEGQEVDSWLDEALPKKGGVGFFAETGERARVYWMKVARNEDFLGRVCAYLSYGAVGSTGSANLQPGKPAAPASGTPAERADIALVVFAFRGSQNRRRSPSWSRY
ncbi:MAG TPA: hypothetical protein VKB88_12555 [Bryobacteraceae bacterium]|nr:hypothetical protein [Bryobacteraceae bacterium]